MSKPESDKDRDSRKWVLVECRGCNGGFWIYAAWSDPPDFCHLCEPPK